VATEAIMPGKVANDRPVLLLDPGLVVLPVWTRSCEFDLSLGAIANEGVVDERTVVVGIDS
jgi:hypothetical protein